jgi:O-succinylbenzoate synthase
MRLRLDVRRYALPFRAPVRTAHGLWPVREGLLVRLERPDGSAGYGEAAPLPGFGAESVDADEAAARALGELVDLGEEGAMRVEKVAADLPCLANALAEARAGAGGGSAQNAQRNSVPLHPSLGVAGLLPAGRAALAAAPDRIELGFRNFKWKVGVGDLAEELGLLDDLCALLPATARIRLDANGGWEPRQAERWLVRCAERPVEFVEQPIARDARGAQDRLLGLAHDYPVPLALDESIAGDADLDRWLAAGWPGVWVIKPSLLADPAAALVRLASARADVVFSSALETGIGARAALRHAFAWEGAGPPGGSRALGFGVWPLFADAQFDGPPSVPVLRWSEVDSINPEGLWNALN